MPLAPNSRLGRYEIRSKIGEGGMGEVYRARDPKLGRDVAIKVLPAAFSADRERLARFEQEACAAGALNHPNILSVYDVGTENGSPYVISELLEGETLREMLHAAQLPQRKALDYALQVARGLSAAHERGIVHRDLKPENIFITADGRAKILDFGLAKLVQTDQVGTRSEAPTRRVETGSGVVMGTVGYMAPEQVRGAQVDQRADIFSFGCILYEMLSGHRAFRGESAADTLSAVLKEDPPDLSESNRNVPPPLARLVLRCLEKRPEQRFQSAGDLGFALEALSTPSGSRLETATSLAVTSSVGKRQLLKSARLAWIVAGVLAMVALISPLVSLRRSSPEAPPITRFSINLPKGTSTVAADAPLLALSPDGRRLVFSTVNVAGKRQLWLRPLDAFATQPLAGTDGAFGSFWSPDGRYIAFFADRKLKKLDTGSGVIETVCPARGGGGAWNRQGVILFGDEKGLSRVNAAGGRPGAVTELDAPHGEVSHLFPSFLPDGKHFLFQVFGGENSGIYVGSLDSRDRKLLIPLGGDGTNATQAVWAPPGYILYALNRRTLLSRAFDPDRLELQGEPFRVAENVVVSGPGVGRFAVSANGVLAFVQGGEADTVQLTWRDRSGKRLGVAGPAAPWINFSLSPDERSAALTRDEPSRQPSIWLLDLVQGSTTRFITEGSNFFPVWSPDGKELAFSSARNGPPNLYLKPLAGNVPEERLLESGSQCDPTSWTPDGKFLIFRMAASVLPGDLWLLPLTGERRPQPVLQTQADKRYGRVSPEGNWLAYQSDEAGSQEIYVTQFPQPVRSWRISRSGGMNPHWRGDSKELFFVAGNKLMAASVSGVSGGAEFQVGDPQVLFEIEGINYAPSRDGQRFLTSVVTEKAAAPPINVVLNWTAELKR